MRVNASLVRLVTKLRTKSWPDDQIRSLLANVPTKFVDQLLASNTETSHAS
jgi:hypothetical protein